MADKNITQELFDSTAYALLQSGDEPTYRKVQEKIGGSATTLCRMLRVWQQKKPVPVIPPFELDRTVVDAISYQVAKTATEAAAHAAESARRSEEELTLLLDSCSQLEVQLSEAQEELQVAQARVLQQEGQLSERMREVETLRAESASSIAGALAQTDRERRIVEGLRQDLVKATLRLEALPHLEQALDACQQRFSAANDELAEARRSGAVAVAQLQSEHQRAQDACQREVQLRGQVSKLECDLAKAWGTERSLRDRGHALGSELASAQGKCSLLEAQLKQVGQRLKQFEQQAMASRSAECAADIDRS